MQYVLQQLEVLTKSTQCKFNNHLRIFKLKQLKNRELQLDLCSFINIKKGIIKITCTKTNGYLLSLLYRKYLSWVSQNKQIPIGSVT